MDLRTAIRLVMENQIGIRVNTQDEAQVILEYAQRLPGIESRYLDPDLTHVPEKWSIFGREYDGCIITWWKDNGYFSENHGVVDFCDLVAITVSGSTVSSLL